MIFHFFRIPATILRPNLFMQNFARDDADTIKAGSLFKPGGQAKISFVDVRDIADVAVKILTEDIAMHAAQTYFSEFCCEPLVHF